MEEYKTNEMTSSGIGQGQFPQFRTSEQNLHSISPEIQERINAAKSNGWGGQLTSVFLRNKKGLIIAIAATLIFALGSYMSRSEEKTSDSTVQNELAVPSQALPGQSAILPIELDSKGDVIIAGAEATITKTANYGEGITHLARYALKEYLAETGTSLSGEQKVYAEDYVQNKTGEEALEVGASLSFSKSLLAEAVEHANALEQWQLTNLKQYSENVSLL